MILLDLPSMLRPYFLTLQGPWSTKVGQAIVVREEIRTL